MKRDLSALANAPFDLLVIGGGILGAGIARDATLRGLRVALIDKADFASGTSSRSSKLIHGGLRYLEQFNFRLVAESCRERTRLRELAPHLVHPCEFIFPVYAGDSRPLWKIRLGLLLYDAIARGSHRTLTPPQIAELEPGLNQLNLRGAVAYQDCREDDARFCLETIFHAADCGAVCANYCELTSLTSEIAHVRDTLTGDAFTIQARHFINAAGPWVEQIAGLAGVDPRSVALSPTKGVHLVLPALTHGRAITFQTQRDNRIAFVIPWDDYSLVGTTDTDWTGDPATAHATPADVDYLRSEVRRLFPAAGDVITTFAGVRALLRSDARHPSARSREHRIVRHRANFLSVAGGKYTTFRLIAEQVVNVITTAPCQTATTPWPVRQRNPLTEEMAMTVSDYLRRRTHLALSRHGGDAENISIQMAAALGWTEEYRRASLAEYRAEWESNRP